MKHTFYILIFFTYLSCSKIKILNKPVTLLPLAHRIDTAKFKSLTETFDLIDVEKIPEYYGGLKPQYEMALFYPSKGKDCLITTGGKFNMCQGILINANGIYKYIVSKNDFRTFFAPIEDEEEALSYVSIYTRTYPQYDFNIKLNYRTFVKKLSRSYAQRVDSGFITMTYYYENFGCGPHAYYSVKSFVDFNGYVHQIERLKVYENPEEDWDCRD